MNCHKVAVYFNGNHQCKTFLVLGGPLANGEDDSNKEPGFICKKIEQLLLRRYEELLDIVLLRFLFFL